MFRRRHLLVGRIRIDAPPEQVWAVIRPAETSPVLDPRCVEAWSEAPAGADGHEVQVHVVVDEGVRLRVRSAVLEEEPPFMARTELVSILREDPPTAMQHTRSGSEFRLEPLEDGGTSFVHVSWEESRRLWRSRALTRTVTHWQQEYLRRTKEWAESAGQAVVTD